MKKLITAMAALFLINLTIFAQDSGTVTVCGKVTDYKDTPLANVTVSWMNSAFKEVFKAVTDSNGNYSAEIAKGRYYAMGALNLDEYVVTGSNLAEEDLRLEYWCWNFVADRDMVFDMRYHRMEVYGLNAFHVQGGTPGFTIYFRPMSQTRATQWEKDGKPAYANLAPDIDKTEITVTINGEQTPIRMKQHIKEYFEPGEYGDAYLLFTDRPKKRPDFPYDVITVRVRDLENGDEGEASYFFEYQQYVR